MSADSEERLMKLEMRLAHFEAMMDDMSDVIAEQGREVYMLRERLRMVTEQLKNMDTGRSPQDDQPPPHY